MHDFDLDAQLQAFSEIVACAEAANKEDSGNAAARALNVAYLVQNELLYLSDDGFKDGADLGARDD